MQHPTTSAPSRPFNCYGAPDGSRCTGNRCHFSSVVARPGPALRFPEKTKKLPVNNLWFVGIWPTADVAGSCNGGSNGESAAEPLARPGVACAVPSPSRCA
jgi:hypothetical protein